LYDPLVLGEQGRKKMGIVHYWIAPGTGKLQSLPKSLLSLDSQTFWSNHHTLTSTESPARSDAVASAKMNLKTAQLDGKGRTHRSCRFGSN
jgi:hypothetical protein